MATGQEAAAIGRTPEAARADPAGAHPTTSPCFSLGLIADIQYADMADTHVEGRTQRFREAPGKLAEAVAGLTALAGRGACQAVLTLGDITNGNREDPARNPSDLETPAAILDGLGGAGLLTYHVLGNHCLDMPQAVVLDRLRFPARDGGQPAGGEPRGSRPRSSHYAARLCPGWRLVALDTTELSGHSHAEPAILAEAAAYVAAHPLSEAEPQMSPWNGGIGRAQAAWLAAQLDAAAAAGDRVIVAAHHQAGPAPAVRPTHAAWNRDEIVGTLAAERGGRPSPVVLYLAGHDHEGGYAHAHGIHWLTLEALVEAPTGSNAWAVLEVWGDRLEVKGRGVATSRRLDIGLQGTQRVIEV
jgi:hypothetical protein